MPFPLPCREFDGPLARAIYPGDDAPFTFEFGNTSVVVVEEHQLDHLIWDRDRLRLAHYLHIDAPADPDPNMMVLRRVIEELDLAYVLRRGVLHDQPNHTYVFSGAPDESGRTTNLLVFPVRSRHLDAGERAERFAELHVPWSLDSDDSLTSEPPCGGCDGVHVRTAVTYFVAEESGSAKGRFLRGEAASSHSGAWFDPTTDCEWFTTLPDAWLVEVQSDLISIVTAGGVYMRWKDADVIGIEAGPWPMAARPEDERRRIASSYREAAASGQL